MEDEDALEEDDLAGLDCLHLAGSAVSGEVVYRDRRHLASLQAIKTSSDLSNIKGVWVIKIKVCMQEHSGGASSGARYPSRCSSSCTRHTIHRLALFCSQRSVKVVHRDYHDPVVCHCLGDLVAHCRFPGSGASRNSDNLKTTFKIYGKNPVSTVV